MPGIKGAKHPRGQLSRRAHHFAARPSDHSRACVLDRFLSALLLVEHPGVGVLDESIALANDSPLSPGHVRPVDAAVRTFDGESTRRSRHAALDKHASGF